MNLNSTKVSTRISILASMSMFVALFLSLSYFWGDRIVSRDFQKQSDFSRLADRVQDVEIGTLQMRRSEKDFLLRKDEKYLKKYEISEKGVLSALEELKNLSVSRTALDSINRLKEGLQNHSETFHQVVLQHKRLGLDEKSGLQGKLRNAVHKIETMIKSTDNEGLMVKMLMMRRHEKDFMLRGQLKYIGRIRKRRKEFDALLAEASYSTEQTDQFSTLMSSYQNGFRNYAQAVVALQPLTKKLSAIFAGMTEDFANIHKISQAGLKTTQVSLTEDRRFTKQLFLGSALITLLIALGLAVLIGRSITNPLRKMTSAMQKLAQGDVSIEIPSLNEKNVIGDMAKAVEVFKRNAIQKQQDEASAKQEQFEKNKRREVMEIATNNFANKIETIVQQLTRVSHQQNDTAHSMAEISENTSSQASSVSIASEQASANVQAVASATEEMTSTIGEISMQVEQASNASRQAVADVEDTSAQMNSLSETANNIGEVIELISSIAEQTNLLALNATIESARAGDAGKGFAVVAGEVKQLASQTAKATEEISKQIGDIQTASKRASGSMENVARTIKNVDEISSSIAAAMEEQGAATQEIANNVHQAATGTQQVNDSINAVTQASQEAGQASERVLSTVDELSTQVEALQKEVNLFVENVMVG